MVRVIIEQNGGDGRKVKEDIMTSYKKGVVWWKDARVAEWCAEEKVMRLKGEVLQYQEEFNKLMQNQ